MLLELFLMFSFLIIGGGLLKDGRVLHGVSDGADKSYISMLIVGGILLVVALFLAYITLEPVIAPLL